MDGRHKAGHDGWVVLTASRYNGMRCHPPDHLAADAIRWAGEAAPAGPVGAGCSGTFSARIA
jgi:hypothetical protein